MRVERLTCGFEKVTRPFRPFLGKSGLEINQELHSDPKILQLNILYHTWKVWAFLESQNPNGIGGQGLKLARRKVDDRVGQQLSSPLQLNPFNICGKAFRANPARGTYYCTTMFALDCHQPPLRTELVEVFHGREDPPILITYESTLFLRCYCCHILCPIQSPRLYTCTTPVEAEPPTFSVSPISAPDTCLLSA